MVMILVVVFLVVGVGIVNMMIMSVMECCFEIGVMKVVGVRSC